MIPRVPSFEPRLLSRLSPLMRLSKRKLIIIACIGCISGLTAVEAGRFLVVDDPERSDVIVVLFGGLDDIREEQGLMLLRKGYAQDLILDVPDWTLYGQKEPEAAQNFLRTFAGDQVGHVHVCKFVSDSTRRELLEISNCVSSLAPAAHSAIIVTSNYHTRRALEIARRLLPQYHWSAAAASDPQFKVNWWARSEYAKTFVTEWQKLLWWALIERWTVR